ncbi:MAG: hypothetical protein U9P42_02955 [Candidatus Fermentibacteria bacterium]|nr:hypothetical protein [Candidatus Fermentibacteria bacterium]
MISRISWALLCLFALFTLGFGSIGEEIALSRLSATTDMLVSIGEEMMGEPMAGMLLLQDTVSIDLSLNSEYTYQFIMWTESTFNYVDFWLTNPQGGTPRGDMSDHTSFSVMPSSAEPEVWKLQMELLEGAACDTAYYAVAVLRRERLVL